MPPFKCYPCYRLIVLSSACRYGVDRALIAMTKQALQAQFTRIQTNLLSRQGSLMTDEQLLPALDAVWALVKSKVFRDLQFIYIYHTQHLLRNDRTKDKKPVYVIARTMLVETVILPFERQLKTGIQELFTRIRHYNEGQQLDVAMLDKAMGKRVVDMLCALGLYGERFEESVISATGGYYEQEGPVHVEGPRSELVRWIHSRLVLEEEAICKAMLPACTHRPLMHQVEQSLIAKNLPVILKSLGPLAFDDRLLEVIVDLVTRIRAQEEFKQAWFALVKEMGTAQIGTPQTETLIERVLALYDSIAKLAWSSGVDTREQEQEQEQRQRQHLKGLLDAPTKEAFECFMNLRSPLVPELLAQHIDQFLRLLAKEPSTDAQVDAFLDHEMILFRHLHSKDLFEAFYKRDLARRLLLSRHAPVEVEQAMIARLRQECGTAFTSRIEVMFKDHDMSTDLTRSFNASRGAKLSDSLSFTVITNGIWPSTVSQPTLAYTLPVDIDRAQKAFSVFYLGQHKNRRLTWNQNLGHCVIRVHFENGPKELVLSIPQALVLMQFTDEVQSLTCQQLQDMTGIGEALIVARTIQSFTRVGILTKVAPGALGGDQEGGGVVAGPVSSEVRVNDQFAFNTQFQHVQHRFKVPAFLSRDESTDASGAFIFGAKIQDEDAVLQESRLDRQSSLDAAIVRTLKKARTIHLTQLQTLVRGCFKWPVSAESIKERLDILEEREFVKRSTEDDDVYLYVQ